MDRIVDSHRAVMADLAEDVGGLGETLREDVGPRFVAPSHEEMLERHMAPIRRERRERAQRSVGIRPVEDMVKLDPPLVTRGGVLYVPPVFEEAAGLDDDSARRVLRAGFRSVDAFLSASDEELVEATGRSLESVRRAKRDLDLMRLPHVDRKAADLLRLAGCPTVSRLAGMDPTLLVRDIDRIRRQYRFLSMPPALNSDRAVRRLVAAAQARSE